MLKFSYSLFSLLAIVSIVYLSSCCVHNKQLSISEKKYNNLVDSLAMYNTELKEMTDLRKDTLLNDYLRLNYDEFRMKYDCTVAEVDAITRQLQTTLEIAKSLREINKNFSEFEKSRKALKYNRVKPIGNYSFPK